jgi:hypothetical protein
MLALALWAAIGGVAYANCPPSDGVRVTVEVSAERVETIFDADLEDLARLAQAAGRQAHMPLRAVYSSRTLYSANIDTQVQRLSSQISCAKARSIVVKITIGKRRIHVARELRDKPCLLRAAANHAYEHARYQEESLTSVREHIASNLADRLREPSPAAGSANEAERKFAQIVSAQIDRDLAKIDTDKAIAARTIDSPEALAELKAACPTEQPDFMNERT